ncbi:hypothetical protein ASPWEDRAFT_139290 [Aspergillus wentii DTO 134E9]|uniref:EKC/KEOPS complex subunit BUD32 n=1 Tax=Aspergillus wentii DTO 134E9 TaxID=1073089 RepID=A0A1L9RAM7_ASPWE|nr:uncharacterized protein ASPWEDRAFT_139290 [Aspergillus wentii DTO 134E9]OJJ31933.1 hypothetical protein ASPWEDRAFT_139290 [Aspergillus wentii DTO 134E9]
MKIFMADFSDWECPELRVNRIREVGAENDSICLPLDQFQVTGPNGSHFCFVYPVAGPKVSCILQEFEEPDRVLRRVGLNAVKAMVALHRFEICHGDFTPSNILLRVSGLDGLPEDRVIQILGQPKTVNVVTSTGEKPSHPSAPQYLVHPVDFQSVHHRYLSDEIYIIDCGKSYHVSLPPDDLDIPQNYYSPELILDGQTGIGSDLWALGCTLFAIRTGRRLFDLFDDDRDDHLYHMVMLLGILPEPWWTSTWSTREDYFDDRPSSNNRAVKTFEALDEPAEPHEPRSIEEMLDHGLVYIESRTGMIPKEVRRRISAEEVTMFADLLGLILRYQPEERLTADLAQHHGWFSM